ncbi:MAG: DUF4032 domain-containing protein [Chloroflexi bacterium]|nr:DUF4032 domain-containing protein [Chloroflexota bacterium]
MEPQNPRQERYSAEMTAQRHFDEALRTGKWRRLFQRFTKQENALIPYRYLQRIVESTNQQYRGLQAVPLDKIIGSLDRSGDFDRIFNPTQGHSRSKWQRVDIANLQDISLPPIMLYKVGEAYFVVDGHHRVSVARYKGQDYIDALVTEVASRVPVTADLTLADLDLLGEYRDFLNHTGLDLLRPDTNLRVTRPEYFKRLQEHINVHRYMMNLDRSQPATWQEAVLSWYDDIYMPIVKAIRKKHMQREFPGLSEADLYLWVIDHAYFLSQKLQHEVPPQKAVSDFIARFSRQPGRVISRMLVALRDRFRAARIEFAPRTGIYRTEKLEESGRERLFGNILVTISGAPSGWLALSQAGEIARREQGVLHGLHVLPNGSLEAQQEADQIQEEYAFRCQSMGATYTFKIEQGNIEQVIIEHGRWADLIVINQRVRTGALPDAPLGSIFYAVAEQATRPLLAVPGTSVQRIEKLLLAYDGSAKSQEALFIMRDLVSRWHVSGVVVTVATSRTNREMLDSAWQYVQHSTSSSVISRYESGDPADVLLRVMQEEQASMLIMGGYGYKPFLKAFLGSTVDRMVREAWFPVLICR